MANIATLIGQTVTFFIFVALCWKFVWPPLVNAMRERQQRMAEGLENAEKAEAALANSQSEATKVVGEARSEGQRIVEQARVQAANIIEEAKESAREEAARIVDGARVEVEQEANRAREALRNDVANLAVAGAEKILSSDIDRNKHAAMLEDLVKEL